MSQHRHIIISGANDCFVRCSGCYNFFGVDKEIVPTNVLLDFLSKVANKTIEKVTISGGSLLQTYPNGNYLILCRLDH